MQKEDYMRVALDLAKKAANRDEVPVGAIIVKNDKIIAKAFNRREKNRDATAHAEILAIKKACKRLKDFRLIGCTMYVTLEPCVMCIGAILNSRLDKVYFGASINKEGALKTEEIVSRSELNHKTMVEGGVLEKECGEIVSGYFKSKRKSKVV